MNIDIKTVAIHALTTVVIIVAAKATFTVAQLAYRYAKK